MKAFFSSLSFPRGVILVCILVAIPLGIYGYLRSQTLSRLEDELTRIPKIVEEIHTLAIQYTKLQERQGDEALGGEGNLDSYIRRAATAPEVLVGSLDLTPSKKKLKDGVVDNLYVIKPSNKKKPYSRAHLANFFYKLEGDSSLVRVTSFELKPLDTRQRPEDVADDTWTFDLTITSRRKEDT